MDYDTLERIVRALQAITVENGTKRAGFSANGRNDLLNACIAENVGIGKALNVLVAEFPDEMAQITS